MMNFCLVALWFESSGKALNPPEEGGHVDWRKVEQCEPLDIWTSIFMGLIFCFVYKALIYIPMGWLRDLLQKSFKYSAEWDEKRSRRVLGWWKCKSIVFWTFAG